MFEGLTFPLTQDKALSLFWWNIPSHPLWGRDYLLKLVGKTLIFKGCFETQTQYRSEGTCPFFGEEVFEEVQVEVPVLHIQGSETTVLYSERLKEFRTSSGKLTPGEVIVIPTEEEWDRQQLLILMEQEGCSTWQELSAKLLSQKAAKEATEKAEELAKKERAKARDEMVKQMYDHLRPLINPGMDLCTSQFGFKLKRKGDWRTLCACYLVENNWDASLEAVQKLIDYSDQWEPPAPTPPSTIQKVREELLGSGLYKSVVIHPGKNARLVLTLLNEEEKEYEWKGDDSLVAIKNLLLKDAKPGRPMPKKKVK